MAQKTIGIGVDVDRETDDELDKWSKQEGRSKRRHVAVILRKISILRRTKPDELQRLGLVDAVSN